MIDAGLAQPGLAFAAGLLTVAAPCVLPLLPVVLGATASGGPGARPVFIAAGFALSFTLLALMFGSVQHLLGLEQQTVRDVAAGLLVVFGLCMVWPRAFQRLSIAAGGLLNRVSSLGDRAGPSWVRALAGHTHRLQQAMGVVVVAVGLLTLLQYDTLVTLWLSDFYPSLAGGL